MGIAVEFYTEGGYLSGDNDKNFNWREAERLAALPDFKVSNRLFQLRKELADV